MRWFEYKAEVDSLHASDELKARLLAIQAGQSAGAGEETAPPPKKPPLRFPWKRAAGWAACFALGAGVCGAALLGASGGLYGVSFLSMGGSSTAEASTYSSADMAAGAAENGWNTASAKMYDLETALTDTASPSEPAAMAEDRQGGTSLTSQSAVTERKIIYTARLYLESKTYDETRAALEAAIQEAGGYIEACDEYSYSSDARSVTLTVRIPAGQYQSFLSAAEGAGNLRNKSEQAEDITAQYIDVAARIANLEAQRTRLQELQAQAESLSDLLEIESKLSDVQYQLESWQSQMAWYDDQVDYCTVTVELSEVKEYTPVRRSFGERFSGAFGDGWTAFVEGLQDMVVQLAYSWPVVLLAVAVAAGGCVWWRKRKSKKSQ